MMYQSINVTIFLLLLCKNCYGAIHSLNESEYGRMPPLYGLEPYRQCLLEPGGVYCVLDASLFAERHHQLMNLITEYSADTMKHFNHTQIHRGVCVTKTCTKHFDARNLNNEKDINAILKACVNESLWRDYKLEVRKVDVINCDRFDEKINIDAADIIMAIVYLAILLVNLVGTLYSVTESKKLKYGKTGNPYLLCFCVRRNWAKMTGSSGSGPEPRLKRLKSFHGLRTITMICVFFSHAAILMNYTYIENPLYVEKAYDDLSKQILLNGSLVVYTFFVMSAFLLAYNFQLHAERHSITWVDMPKGILHRWFRLTPAYLVVLGTVSTWQRHLGSGPLWYLLVETEAKACRNYWWLHPLYINNYIYEDAFCMPQTWYLAADMQLFCVGIAICVLMRSERSRSVTLWILFVTALVIPAAHTYFQNLDAAVMQTPETMRGVYSKDDTFRLLYIRGHTNLATYVLGLAGGFLTYRWQKQRVDISKYKRYVWLYWCTFPLAICVILSGGIFYVDHFEIPIGLRVAYAVLYKPAFQILVVIGIIGFVFKYERVYRRIVEWRGWTWCGRVSYSAFLLHTLFQRCFFGAMHQAIHVFDYFMLIVLCATIFMTYISAAALWLLVEEPMNQLFKLLLRGETAKGQPETKNVDSPVSMVLTKL